MSSDILFVFGDQSHDLLPSIRHLNTRSRHNHPLRSFTRVAIDTIQHILSALPTHIRPAVPPFDSLSQLADAIGNGSQSTPLISSLLTLLQIGNLIEHLASDPRALDRSRSTPAFIGACTGSIAAAVVASCRNLTELLDLAPQAITLSFYVGLEASRRSCTLDPSEDSWATIIKDVNPDELQDDVQKFNLCLTEQIHKRVYISAITESCVTISGPPTIVQRFFDESSYTKNFRKSKLPIRSAFHARHLIPVPHFKIFNQVNAAHLQRQVCHPLLSCCGARYNSNNLYDVLAEIVHEILQQPIDWRHTGEALHSILKTPATVISMSPCYIPSTLSQWQTPSKEKSLLNPDEVRCSSPQREGSGNVAIVGMSVRAPGSETLEEFWDILQKGKDLHQRVPSDRFDINAYYDPSGKQMNSTITPYGAFIDRPGFFDPRFFNMSPREALQTDPQQRLMLLTTYEALENSGYSPNRTSSSETRRIASFVGQTGDDYREFNANQNIDTHFITGNIRAFGPGRLNYHFGWEGPSYSIDTACSSSGASIQLACSALLSRQCDTAVSGGANLLTSPDLFAGLSRGGFLSKTGGCKTFDKDADGYVRGEACGMVVLKRLEDAIADHDNILAVIRGARTNHSAEAVSITHPHAETQERLFRAVLDDAGVSPHQVDLAEMHGTGTQAGDGIESRSVIKVLCQGRAADSPLIMSTIKPNIGHGEAASGVSSLIKAVLMMQRDTIPPHVGIKTSMSDKLPLSQTENAKICLEARCFVPRPNGDGKRKILINNFDAAGGNSCILIEDPPALNVTGRDPRGHKIITFSAKSSRAISNNIRKTLSWLKNKSDARIEDVSYTTTSRRMHYPFRQAYTATSTQHLIAVLEKQDLTSPVQKISSNASAVFCFTGQGSQYPGMGLQLYHAHSTFHECIDQYASICDSFNFPSFLPVLHGDTVALKCPIRTQLSIVATELAMMSLWMSWGIQPSAVIGHSLGEFPALCCAGVISISDCLYLVGKRADLIARKCTPNTHAMLAVQADEQMIKLLTEDIPDCNVESACINSPTSTVIGGLTNEIKIANDILQQNGLNTKFLPVQHAFHSSQLDTILDELESLAHNVTYRTPKLPVASPILGETITSEGFFGPSYLRCQTRGPVRFQKAIDALSSTSLIHDKTVWIELGPSPACLAMIKAIQPGVRFTLPSLQKDRDDWQVLASSTALAYKAGLNINWHEFNRPFEKSLQLLQLPNYSFDLKDYWMPNRTKAVPEQYPCQSRPKMTAAEQQRLFRPSHGLHRIERFETNLECTQVEFAADTVQPDLNKALSGHLVNGEPLCPSSVYADMAFAAATFFSQLEGRGEGFTIEIANMEVTKPLILSLDTANQVIRVTAVKKSTSLDVKLRFSSRSGTIYQHHATCIARLRDPVQNDVVSTHCEDVARANVERLRQLSAQGKTHRILRSMVYKLFKGFVDYDREYQGLTEVFLNAEMLEAAACVNFQSSNTGFICNPYWIDSIAHLSGFILNGSEFTPDDSVFISHGWESLNINRTLCPEKTYQSYVRMQPSVRRTVFIGDVYLIDDAGIAAVCQGLKFQQINRDVLDRIIPSTGSTPLMTRSKGRQSTRLLPTSWRKGPSGTPAAEPVRKLATDILPIESDFKSVLRIYSRELKANVFDLDHEASFISLGVTDAAKTNIAFQISAQLKSPRLASVFNESCSLRDLETRLMTILPSEKASSDEVAASESKSFSKSDFESMGTKIRDALARQLGLTADELEDDASFADLGVDSLLTMSILSSLNELVDEQLPASLFIQYPTVKDLCQRLQNSPPTTNSTTLGKHDELEPASCEGDLFGAMTPATEYGDCNESCLAERNILTEIMRKIVAEEIGISTTEIDDDALLLELGVDSLFTFSILARIKEQTGMTLASTFFIENPTFRSIEQTLQTTPPTPSADIAQPEKIPSVPFTPPEYTQSLEKTPTKLNNRSCSSILLQGSSTNGKAALFLIPDGSGRSSSYVKLPWLNYDGAVYGLNSPFLGDLQSFETSLHELVALYVAEIRRIQPEGPYHIGGWSIGGICAFEAASQLIREHGQEVASLILIDAPCPTIFPPLPLEDVDFLQSIGAFDTIQSSLKVSGGDDPLPATIGLHDETRNHFTGSIRALERYNANMINSDQAPKSVLITWARQGVWETLRSNSQVLEASKSKSRHVTTNWLMGARSNFGTCGWEKLLPSSDFTCHTIPGDHFSMMRQPGVLELGAKIRSFCAPG